MCLQGKYNTPEKHKEAMLGFLKGWNAPHVKRLIAETPADKILLSNIYERRVKSAARAGYKRTLQANSSIIWRLS